ncbi:concanavalin A-like lectin/glucanase domain-containing protein [Aspergillus lucknowensis]|uniref:Concanavalin A-like lectin/glucanase domain-containing protein n=1 Tax=Aspergillus lucknowensis TaxID=176173 RepID=A0ABR4M441_9EURO
MKQSFHLTCTLLALQLLLAPINASSLPDPTLPNLPGLIHSILPDLDLDLDLGLDPSPIPDDDSDSPTPQIPVPDPGADSDADTGIPIPPPLLGYTLTWHDEFTSSSSPSQNEENSHLPSSANWLFDTGTSYPSGAQNWGNNELQSYTTSPENIHLTPSGTLSITPRFNREDGGEGHWTSARIETTSTTFAARPGGRLYIESRLRTGCAPPAQQRGIWPAFWALGQSFREDPTYWPMASEWDFVEVINDGQQTHTVSGADVGDFDVWERVAHQGHFLLFNVAVGGNWPGYPDGNTIDGEEVGLEVDYVRVWNS